jgi:hypothetical protein
MVVWLNPMRKLHLMPMGKKRIVEIGNKPLPLLKIGAFAKMFNRSLVSGEALIRRVYLR